jgi:hypothetical protein
MAFSDVNLFSKKLLASFFNHLFQSIAVALVHGKISSFNASFAALSATSFPSIPVCAGTHINFKLFPFSASLLKIVFCIEFLPGKTFSNAVRLLRVSVIMILLQFVSLCGSIAFKIANIWALKIVVCGNNRHLSLEEDITTAQPTCSSLNDPAVKMRSCALSLSSSVYCCISARILSFPAPFGRHRSEVRICISGSVIQGDCRNYISYSIFSEV